MLARDTRLHGEKVSHISIDDSNMQDETVTSSFDGLLIEENRDPSCVECSGTDGSKWLEWTP
jgi:hypothetical protein